MTAVAPVNRRRVRLRAGRRRGGRCRRRCGLRRGGSGCRNRPGGRRRLGCGGWHGSGRLSGSWDVRRLGCGANGLRGGIGRRRIARARSRLLRSRLSGAVGRCGLGKRLTGNGSDCNPVALADHGGTCGLGDRPIGNGSVCDHRPLGILGFLDNLGLLGNRRPRRLSCAVALIFLPHSARRRYRSTSELRRSARRTERSIIGDRAPTLLALSHIFLLGPCARRSMRLTGIVADREDRCSQEPSTVGFCTQMYESGHASTWTRLIKTREPIALTGHARRRAL